MKGIFSKYVADIIKVYPSYTNFVLTKGVLAQQLGAFIHENGFKPRFYDEEVMRDYVRYSIATEEQLHILEEVVKKWREHYDVPVNS